MPSASGSLRSTTRPSYANDLQPLDGIGGVAGLGGGKAVGFEAGDDGLAEIEVVFDDQNGGQGALAHISCVSTSRRGSSITGRLAPRWEGLFRLTVEQLIHHCTRPKTKCSL